jgi:aldose 1-epimerase
VTPFGTLSSGEAVHALDIAGGDISARFLTRGATLRSLRLRGVLHDLTVGSDDLALYEGPDGPLIYHGAIVGPVANRIRGARAVVEGRACRFPANQGGHLLHSGAAGTQFRVWEVLERAGDRVLFGLTLPDGEGGFPGNRRITARFTALPPATLRLELIAVTDAPTLMNPVNHSYWNLDGTPTWEGHGLRIAADAHLPVDADLLPTGEVRPVEGTPFDLRAGRRLTPGEPLLDHNFCLSRAPEDLREVLWLTGATGLAMALATTAPGVQVYDGNQGARPGGERHEAFAIEPQLWPDAPSHPDFPSILLRPGEVWRQVTEWRFAYPR